MRDDILKLFNLQGYGLILYKLEVREGEVILKVGNPRRGAYCVRCGCFTRSIHERGKWRKVFHQYALDKKVYLMIRKARYFCKHCKRAFTEQLDFISLRQRKTHHAEQQILKELRGQSFKSVKEKVGVSYPVAIRVLMKKVTPGRVLWIEEKNLEKISVGIDAHSFRGTQLVNTVTNLSSPRPLTILPDNRKDTIKRFFSEIPEEIKKKIKEVCIDMDWKLKQVMEEELPSANIVVDHYHVIQDANRRVDEARRIEQDAWKVRIPRRIFLVGGEKLSKKDEMRLQRILNKYPSLKEFYWMKEALREFYRLTNREEAEERLRDLIAIAGLSDDAEMVRWSRTLERWSEYILNYFHNRTTNAYTEGIHTKIKMVKRVSFGFRNVEVYVRKVLLAVLPLAFILSSPHFLT